MWKTLNDEKDKMVKVLWSAKLLISWSTSNDQVVAFTMSIIIDATNHHSYQWLHLSLSK